MNQQISKLSDASVLPLVYSCSSYTIPQFIPLTCTGINMQNNAHVATWQLLKNVVL